VTKLNPLIPLNPPSPDYGRRGRKENLYIKKYGLTPGYVKEAARKLRKKTDRS